MSALVLAEARGPVTRLTLNDPATRNSLSEEMMAELSGALARTAEDKTVRAVVIAAVGPAYCAGHNLKDITRRRADPDRGRGYFEKLLAQCAGLMKSIVRHPKPVIAEVHAIASAAGCQLVASCDLAVASGAAAFQTPGVHIGLFCSTPMVALSRNVAPKHAMEMLLTGDAVPAEDARRMGLVNRVVPANELAAAAMALAEQIASKPAATVKTGKRAFYEQRELPLDEAYDYASLVMTENLLAREAREGIGAFLDKRAPDWEQ